MTTKSIYCPTNCGVSSLTAVNKLQAQEQMEESSEALSSPPSDAAPPHPGRLSNLQLHTPKSHEAGNNPNFAASREIAGVEPSSTSPSATVSTRHTPNIKSQPQPGNLSVEKPKVKRARKKAVMEDEVSKKVEKTEKVEKAPRKTRAASGVKPPARKKAKIDANEPTTSIQRSISDYSATNQSGASPTPNDFPARAHEQPMSGASAPTNPAVAGRTSPPPAPRMSYDPVRSMMVERDPPKVYSSPAPPPGPPTPVKNVVLRPIPSPASIFNIIDPPTESSAQSKPQAPQESVPEKSAATSKPPSPKPVRNKEPPPPLPQGSGLLSSALFGGTTNGAGTATKQAPTVVVHIQLANPDNNIINFAQLAEQKYGFGALNPRLAQRRERLAQVAAMGASLEKTNGSRGGRVSTGDSGDDLSLDIDTDNDGDVAMTNNGGGTGANSGTDATGPKRRKRKAEGYDADDPFVDDTELAWEAQAAAVKDGFFVYSGPLIPEGEKPAVERADGTVKRGRGRGRGGGPGSRGGRGGAAANAAASADGGTAAGGGRGSRGGGTTRRPRASKRALAERLGGAGDKMAPLAAKPTAFPNPA